MPQNWKDANIVPIFKRVVGRTVAIIEESHFCLWLERLWPYHPQQNQCKYNSRDTSRDTVWLSE